MIAAIACCSVLLLVKTGLSHFFEYTNPAFSQAFITLLQMEVIKKRDKLTLRQMRDIELAEDLILQGKQTNLPKPVLQPKPVPAVVPNYIPHLDNPAGISVCNSGWQVSDILRDLRVD